MTDQEYHHDTTRAGDAYGHDVDYHHGTGFMHEIEHSYDELFH
jgi:hypothetical protein